MTVILGLIGLAVGGSLGGFGGAIALCIAGVMLGNWINRGDEARKARRSGPASTNGDGSAPHQPFNDFDSLREEVIALRRRVAGLEARLPGGKPAEPAPAPEPMPVAAPAAPIAEEEEMPAPMLTAKGEPLAAPVAPPPPEP